MKELKSCSCIIRTETEKRKFDSILLVKSITGAVAAGCAKERGKRGLGVGDWGLGLLSGVGGETDYFDFSGCMDGV